MLIWDGILFLENNYQRWTYNEEVKKNSSSIILNELLQHPFCSIRSLSVLCDVSYKLIQAEIDSLNDFFKQKHYETRIVSERGKGVYYNPKNKNEILSAMKQLGNNEEDVRYFILSDIFNNPFNKLDEFCEKYYLSRSNMNRLLSEIKDELRNQHIEIASKPHYGIYIEAKEETIRRYLMKTLLPLDEKSRNGFLRFNSKQYFSLIEDIVATICKYDVIISDVVIDQFTLAIKIMIARAENGERLQKSEIDRQCFEYYLAERIFSSIKECGIAVHENELLYLFSIIKGMIRKKEDDVSKDVYDETQRVIDEGLAIIYDKYGYDFRGDAELNSSLLIHLKALIDRAKNNNFVSNPMLNTIKSYSLFAYDMAVDFSDVFSKITGEEISDDEISYIAIYLHLAMNRIQVTAKKINAIVICPAGRSMSQLFSHYLKDRFGDYINSLDVCSLYNIGNVDFKKYDYAFSMIPLQKEIPIPLILFDINEDMKKVAEIRKKISGAKEEYPLLAFFDDRLFIERIKETEKEKIIKKIIDVVGKTVQLSDGFMDSVLQREEIVPTELDTLFAIPHPIGRNLADHSFFSVAVLEKPVVWNEKKVCVILLSYILSDSKELDAFYDSFARFVSDKKYALELYDEPTLNKLKEIAKELI